ncbi:hypothetical protein HanPI659440_Chr17g0681411 [Helianthus annuus]|nr:hypothetical protein HanPI659440_Chr17g0681411 [Helianthus annuus]
MVFDEKEWVCVYFVSSNCISEEERKRLSLIDKKERERESERERKRKRKRLSLSPINKKKRLLRFCSLDKMSMKPAYKRRKKVRRFNGELKDMKKLRSNDEAFRLSWKTLS